MKAGIEFIFA